MDFKVYQSQIRSLIPLRQQADFNDLLNKVLFGESNSDKFLIKMELSRLAQPCARIIDLRDKVNDRTSEYKHQGLKHHFNPSAIKAFENAINLHGNYTIGVYEAVLEHVQKIKLQQVSMTNVKPASSINSHTSESIRLNNHNTRAAPRMFFVSPITITLESGDEYQAATSNISITGLKIKLIEDIHCLNHELIQVMFTGLSKENKNQEVIKNKINYRLVKQEKENNAFYFYLNIDENNAGFIDFTHTFIRKNQYRYKMDVHYYFQLARENALKNSTLLAMNSLPIYLDANSSNPVLFMLKNTKNANIISDWRCNDANQLTFLFNKLRLLRLLEYAKTKPTTTVYSFTYISNNIEYLLSATEEELKNDNLKQLFIEYGKSKLNWRCYHLALYPYTYHADQKYDITAVQPPIFSQITHLATLTELTTDEPVATQVAIKTQRVNLLNKFVNRETQIEPAIVYDLFPEELRKEERYHYSSSINLSDGDYSYTGTIVDFSLSGLKIKLEQVAALAKRSTVKVDFIDFQKLSKQFSLIGIKYQVISSSPGNCYHLQVTSKESFIAIRKFLSLLIKNNPKHFSVIPLKAKKQPVTARLHEVAESSLNQALFFVTSNQTGKPKISYSSIPPNATSLKKLFGFDCDPYKEHNYIALSNNQLLERILFTPLRNALNSDISFEQTIYVRKTTNKQNKSFINSYLDDDFASEENKKLFITEQKRAGQLQILHYRLSTIKTPDFGAIKSEVKIISRYAMHLTKRIEDELLSVNAMIEIIDRTEHIMNDESNESNEA